MISSTSVSLPNLAWKAGLSGYPGIESLTIFNETWAPYISWYSNYEPIAPNVETSDHTIIGAPMLWGKGDQCLSGTDGPVDAERLSNFTVYVAAGETAPSIFFGFYEPDCDCDSSSHIPSVPDGIDAWNTYLAPLRSSNSIPLGSPSMCTQLDQKWLTEFNQTSSSHSVPEWDVTSIHVNKPTSAEGIAVVEYYYQTFGKPVWITELTCVDDSDWSSCGDQNAVNSFIDGMVDFLEETDYVYAYGANNGEGVPGVWNLMESSSSGKTLTATGEYYLEKLQSLKSSSSSSSYGK
ncbi:hypothetical protein UCRPC4_g04711 [Phaeomoniella chlamydospora]|uniref:Asl1-like glycosyl hydrolase catalytic domain-containing protein n=1 Tax=Phaeomoniella chlamydospora TaxID=158046 RepID=A0A0G2E9B1_PHACM|nr:hypothetical protein UCRPC4_g04711 [Phaeomoniella chlamydospora]